MLKTTVKYISYMLNRFQVTVTDRNMDMNMNKDRYTNMDMSTDADTNIDMNTDMDTWYSVTDIIYSNWCIFNSTISGFLILYLSRKVCILFLTFL